MPSEYKIITNSAISHWVLGVLANHGTGRSYRVASKNAVTKQREDSFFDKITYTYSNKETSAELIIKNINKCIPPSCHSLIPFIFIIGNQQGWKNNRASFHLDELVLFKGEDPNEMTRRIARKQFKAALEALYEQSIALTRVTKKTGTLKAYGHTRLISSFGYQNNYCYVEFTNYVLQTLNVFPQLFPTWSGSLKNQKSSSLTIYIFYRIKQLDVFDGRIKLKIQDLLCYMGIPYEKNQVNNRRYKQLIVAPFLKAIADIEAVSTGTITFEIPPYQGIDDFLTNTVTVNYEDAISNYYIQKKRSH